VSLHRLLRWAKNRRTPLWDPAASPPLGPVRFCSELRTAAQIVYQRLDDVHSDPAEDIRIVR
jgi:hypothetical protein